MKILGGLTILSLLVFVVPSFTHATSTTQVLIGGSTGNVSTGNVSYGIGGFGSLNNSGTRSSAFPVSGTLSNFTFYVKYAPGGTATRTMTLRDNGVSTSVTCTIASGSNSCTDSTHTASFAVGDYATLGVTVSGTPAASTGSWSFVFTPTVANDTIFLTSSTNIGSKSYGFYYIPNGLDSINANSGSYNSVYNFIMPEAGTMDQLQATTSSIGSGSYQVSIFQNNATSTLLCTIQSPNLDHCGDTTDSLSIAQGDLIKLNQEPSATAPTNNLNGGFGVRFVPTVAGDFDFLDYSVETSGTTVYNPIEGYAGGGTKYTAEASTTAMVPAAMTFTGMELKSFSALGAGITGTTTLRVNGADSSLVCTLVNNTIVNNCTGSVSVNAGDLVDLSETFTSGVSNNFVILVGLVANTGSVAPPPSTSARIIRLLGVRLYGVRLQ